MAQSGHHNGADECPLSGAKRISIKRSILVRQSRAIKAEANNGAFYVSVRDTGPGISAADQAKLFQEFQQADNAFGYSQPQTRLPNRVVIAR